MHIGIDAHTIGKQKTGNETYIANLVAALADTNGDFQYRLYVTDRNIGLRLSSNFNLRLVPESGWARFGLSLPIDLLKRPVDLLHVQYAAPPTRCPLVVTIHDVSYNFIPMHIKISERWRVKKLFPWTAARAARIITGTNGAKADIVKWLNVPPEKITVIPYGVSEQYAVIEDKSEVASALKRIGLPTDYILFVGNLQPRKNLVRLIEAFAVLKIKHKIEEKLILAGKKAWLYEDILAAPYRLGIVDDVVFADYINDGDLPFVYNGAKLFVLPSLHEGFGFPPLEAMACGIPVVASDAPALPEVLGKAAHYVDPLSVESIAEGILTILSDRDRQKQLIEQGKKRVVMYNWKETARLTLDVYSQVGADK